MSGPSQPGLLCLPEPVSAVTVSSPVKSGPVPSPRVDPAKLFPSDAGGAVVRNTEGVKEPLIGLEYLVEVREDGFRTNPKIICLLCSKEIQASSIVGHLLSATHRLAYLEAFFPIARRKFSRVPNLGLWQKPTFNHLESVVARIETKLGRLKPWVVMGNHFLNIEMEEIRATVEEGKHFREAVGLNFRTIPDPFESYIQSLPSQEILEVPTQGQDPKPKPGIDLSVPYSSAMALRNSSQSGESSRESMEKSNVLNRIANLRKEISRDEKCLEVQKKLRDEVKVKDKFRKRSPAREDQPETVDLSDDDDNQPSRDLKLRKPERRGIRSRNPEGKSSRSERDRESRIPERELYMDRVQSQREKSRERPRRSPEKRRERRRSRSRSRRRGRSVSPYVTAMENWNKFKRAEKAMLADICSRRDLAERRPEDHPRYGPEWKQFWEKRYRELQSQGRDPNKHDFKAEWVPYWTKQVAGMFDNEVLERTNDLMRKFNLSSVAEPKRDDFNRGGGGGGGGRGRISLSREGRSRSRSRGRPGPGFRRSRSRSPRTTKRRSRSRSPPVKRTEREDRRENGNTSHRVDFRGGDLRGGDLRGAGGEGGGGRPDPGRRGEERFSGVNWRQQEELQQSLDQSVPPGPPAQSPADVYSGITELEDRRDRGRTRSPARPAPGSSEELVPCLRLLTALEDTLGSLGPLVNQAVARALSLEQRREGSSRVMLEDPDTAALLEMVKEKLAGQMMAGLVGGSREGAVRVSLDHLTRLLQVATRARSANISSYLAPPHHQPDLVDTERNRSLLAETLASSLVQAGRQDIREDELVEVLEQLLRMTVMEDPTSSLGRYAKSFLETAASEREAARRAENQFDSYDSARPVRRPEMTSSQERAGTLDNLTLGDLRALMRNFQTLSRPEQDDLMSYMRKLETSNPEKARRVKEGMRSSPAREEAEARNDWSPPFSKRRRRLSGSDLEINPVNPADSAGSDHQREPREDDWELEPSGPGVGSRQEFTQRNFHSVNTQNNTARVASFGIPLQQPGGFGGLRSQEEEPYNPFQRQERNLPADGGFNGGGMRNPAFANREEGSDGIPLLNPALFRQNNRYQNW